jgi:hypothetical protein
VRRILRRVSLKVRFSLGIREGFESLSLCLRLLPFSRCGATQKGAELLPRIMRVRNPPPALISRIHRCLPIPSRRLNALILLRRFGSSHSFSDFRETLTCLFL